MSKVIMMCGVCGSGKTTYAKKKEQEGYIRLSIDEEPRYVAVFREKRWCGIYRDG